MGDPTGFRRERIEKLLTELRYEIERGIMEREIDETIGFSFIVPVSNVIPGGVVYCELRTRPVTRYAVSGDGIMPRLHLVKA